MGRPSLVVVLAEDERHQNFVRRYLRRLKYSRHEIRFRALPSGRGCGEQWVRERYAQEVREFRKRSARARTGLVVAIDADIGDMDQRVRQLQERLDQAGLSPRTEAELIVHFIPKRSIETWILCLNGRQVDEDTDYRHEHDIDGQIPAASVAFFDWSRPGVEAPEHSVPSLRSAIPEVRRLG